MSVFKTCGRCGTEIKLTEDMPWTPRITYFSGNTGASEEIVYLCPICRKGFIDWFKSRARRIK
jgi:DNA-directed RNA polymerase subunit RPC12/RpoP